MADAVAWPQDRIALQVQVLTRRCLVSGLLVTYSLDRIFRWGWCPGDDDVRPPIRTYRDHVFPRLSPNDDDREWTDLFRVERTLRKLRLTIDNDLLESAASAEWSRDRLGDCSRMSWL